MGTRCVPCGTTMDDKSTLPNAKNLHPTLSPKILGPDVGGCRDAGVHRLSSSLGRLLLFVVQLLFGLLFLLLHVIANDSF